MHGSRDVDERGTGNNAARQGPVGVVPATESGPIKCGLGYTRALKTPPAANDRTRLMPARAATGPACSPPAPPNA